MKIVLLSSTSISLKAKQSCKFFVSKTDLIYLLLFPYQQVRDHYQGHTRIQQDFLWQTNHIKY